MFDVARLESAAAIVSGGKRPGALRRPPARAQAHLHRAGTNRQFINGSPTTLNILATLGEWLVDIHGPHDHQSLLHPARQLAILDAFGGLDGEREAFGELVRRRAALEAEKAALIVDEKTYAQQLDLLRFQVQRNCRRPPAAGGGSAGRAGLPPRQQRRQAARTQPGRAGLAERKRDLAAHPGRRRRAAPCRNCSAWMPAAAPLWPLHEQAVAALRELQAELSRYADKVDLDPARLQQLEERLNLIHSLKRKYGATLAEVIAFGDEARRKLQSLEQRDAELARLNAELAEARSRTLARRPGAVREAPQSDPAAQQGRRASNSPTSASSKATSTSR